MKPMMLVLIVIAVAVCGYFFVYGSGPVEEISSACDSAENCSDSQCLPSGSQYVKHSDPACINGYCNYKKIETGFNSSTCLGTQKTCAVKYCVSMPNDAGICDTTVQSLYKVESNCSYTKVTLAGKL